MADGTRRTIQYICENKITDNVLTMVNDKIVSSPVYDWFDSGDLDCYELTTEGGRVNCPSSTHPYYTPNGWISVSDLSVGDYVAVPHSASVPFGVDSDDDMVLPPIMALLCFFNESILDIETNPAIDTVFFSSQDYNLILIDYKLLMSKIYPDAIYLESFNKCSISNPSDELLALQEDIDNAGGVLEYVMTRSDAFVQLFLGEYLLTLHRLEPSSLRLSRESIVLDVPRAKDRLSLVLLFSRVDICFKIGIYHIYCTNSLDVSAFYYRYCVSIPFFASAMSEEIAGTSYFGEMGLGAHPFRIPYDYLTTEEKLSLISYSGRSEYNSTGLSVGFLRTSILLKNTSRLLKFANSDIHFEKIVSLKQVGKHKCYDISIRDSHNFVADGIIVHNTSQFCNIAWNLGKYNDDVIPIIYTIDDSDKELVPRLVTYDMSMRVKDTNPDLFNLININKVATPFLYKDAPEYDAVMSERSTSYQNLFSLISDEKLCILDSSNGSSIDVVSNTVRHFSDRYPDKRIIMFVDEYCPR